MAVIEPIAPALEFEHLSIVPQDLEGLLFVDFVNKPAPTPNPQPLMGEVFELEGVDYALSSMGQSGLIVGLNTLRSIIGELRSYDAHDEVGDPVRIQRLEGARDRHAEATRQLNSAHTEYISRYTLPPLEDNEDQTSRRLDREAYRALLERTSRFNDQPTLKTIVELKGRSNAGFAELQRAEAERFLRILYDRTVHKVAVDTST